MKTKECYETHKNCPSHTCTEMSERERAAWTKLAKRVLRKR